MAEKVLQGRRGARIEGDFVVFLIGARLDPRNPIRSLRDLGGRRGMPAMLRYLTEHPEKGPLGYESYGLTMSVQYWRSFEHLERFARDESDPHLQVWRDYWKRVGNDPRSGIWHETFLVRAGEYEAVYGNMPPHGLARASEVVPIGTDSSARGRLRRRSS
ncbi:DUF4188 domain-containing protein [Nocardioides anomalus]|uniref:DUF4188 domain-containing protein n=1 Tax=Nocardioides anomalus TaxID=2712223 RepID=A0A6G6WAE3_9ACTN|nr:DUF4188 domain-containing protein [Nocardioides anomalus]QIG42202.1 DUF4188 domain-containing protein [Nocardioides anomalus]